MDARSPDTDVAVSREWRPERCDRIALLFRSKKLLDGTVKEIKNLYKDRVPLPPPVEPEPELEKIFIKAVQDSGLQAPTAEELQ